MVIKENLLVAGKDHEKVVSVSIGSSTRDKGQDQYPRRIYRGWYQRNKRGR